MGRPLVYEIIEKPVTSCLIAICSGIWFYIQQKNIGYADVGVSYENLVLQGQYWRILTASFSHISFLHLIFNMSALWSLGIVESLNGIGLGVNYYLQYTMVLLLLSSVLVIGMYHILINRFRLEFYKRVTAVGYSCVVFGWMTILAAKQPSSKLELFGVLSLPINFAPFESLVFTSIIVPQASFLGHLAGILVGYMIAWGAIQGMNNFWLLSSLAWIILLSAYSVHQTTSYQLPFLQIESIVDPATTGMIISNHSSSSNSNNRNSSAPLITGSQLV